MTKPKVSSESEKELENVEKQFDKFNEEVKQMTNDRMNEAPKLEMEQQSKISQKDLEKSNDTYLKPIKTISVRDKFNEKFRKDWEFKKKYVHFVAQNNEIAGENIELWTRPMGGIPAEYWQVPVNKPVWGPRYLAEQIKRKVYHRLIMENRPMNADGMGQYYGSMAVDKTIQRLDAHPVSKNKSMFMGEQF